MDEQCYMDAIIDTRCGCHIDLWMEGLLMMRMLTDPAAADDDDDDDDESRINLEYLM